MLTFLISIVNCVLFTFASQASTVVIGNAGEGYRLSGQIFLRDFVENNVYLKPYFGKKINTEYIQERDVKLLNDLRLNSTLVNQKLNDLDSIYPGLAKVLVKVMGMYSWELISDPLALLPDDGRIIDIPYSERIQLANRSLLTVKLQKEYWLQLTPENRVGLFMHELIFSLVKPEQISAQSTLFYQSARLVRQIVGAIFSEETYLDSQVKNSVLVLMQMTLGLTSSSLETQYTLRVSARSQQGLSLFINQTVSEGELDVFLDKTCSYLKGKAPEAWAFISAVTMPQIISTQFQTLYGSEISQKVDFQMMVNNFQLLPEELSSQCVTLLKNKVLLKTVTQ